MQLDFAFAIRHYGDMDRVTREWFELRDRMVRKPCGSFSLFIAGELPGDPETERPMSLEDVFAWYRDCPEQIERVIFSGAVRRSEFTGENIVQSSVRPPLSFGDK